MIEKRYGHPDVDRVHERYLAFMATKDQQPAALAG
jgi:hypothetical protein